MNAGEGGKQVLLLYHYSTARGKSLAVISVEAGTTEVPAKVVTLEVSSSSPRHQQEMALRSRGRH